MRRRPHKEPRHEIRIPRHRGPGRFRPHRLPPIRKPCTGRRSAARRNRRTGHGQPGWTGPRSDRRGQRRRPGTPGLPVRPHPYHLPGDKQQARLRRRHHPLPRSGDRCAHGRKGDRRGPFVLLVLLAQPYRLLHHRPEPGEPEPRHRRHQALVLPIQLRAARQRSNYLYFTDENDGCHSSIGMVGGRQKLWLDDDCTTGNAIHEIGHALGLFHEQSRSDRDTYITVKTGPT